MEISQLLSEALSADQNKRNEAEMNIDFIATKNFGLFLINCSKELCDESKHKGIRQIASTLIKNMISYTPKYKGWWEQLDKDTKLQVKQHVLSTLASSDKDVRKAAGIAVAGICKVELPLGEWQDIIDILCQTSTNENKFIQLASVTTLGYISTEISTRDLNDEQVGKILNTLYTLLSNTSDFDLQDVCLNALLNFIPFIKRFFLNKDQKSLVLDIIYKYTQNQEIKLRIIAIQCLLEIVRQYYDNLEENIKDLLNTTKLHMLKDDESCAILAYEIWCSIGDIEIARIETKNYTLPCRNYCNAIYRELLEVIFQHLLTVANSSNEDGWNLSKAASCLLSILSQCCEYQLIQEVIIFIGNNIGHNTSFNREAAILAFGAILDTRHKENMGTLVINSIETLINFLIDQTTPNSLKETTSWVIEKIAELYGESFLRNADLFDKLMNSIISLLPTSRRRVICHLCNAVHFFSTAFKPEEGQNSNLMSKHVKNLLELFLKLAFTPKSYDANDNVAMNSFFAIGSLVENAAPDTKFIIQSFFNDLFEAFKSTLNPKFFENDKMRYDYQAYIASSLETCFICGYLQLNFVSAKEILGVIIMTFTERKNVYEEGLMAASGLALCVGQEFEPLIKDFGSYLVYALNSISDTSLCKTAIHSTSDLIRSIGSSFSLYLDQIIPIILNILSNTEADKILKPHSFNVITDVFITCKETVFNYFKDIMELIGSALEAATYLPEDKEDFENIEYFESLREQILECLTCIFQTVKDMKREEDFKRFVLPIVNFINTINGKQYSHSTVI